MPAVHDLPLDWTSQSAAQALTQPLSPDPQLGRHRIAEHLLRDLEARRLPSLISIDDQVRHGAALSAGDRSEVTRLVELLDRLVALRADDSELRHIRDRVVRLCNQILTQAHANKH